MERILRQRLDWVTEVVGGVDESVDPFVSESWAAAGTSPASDGPAPPAPGAEGPPGPVAYDPRIVVHVSEPPATAEAAPATGSPEPRPA